MSRKRKTEHANYVEIIEVTVGSSYVNSKKYILKSDYKVCDENEGSLYFSLSCLDFKKGSKVRVQWPDGSVTKEEIARSYIPKSYDVDNSVLGFRTKVNGLETIVIANLKKLRFNEKDIVASIGLTKEDRLEMVEIKRRSKKTKWEMEQEARDHYRAMREHPRRGHY